MTNGVEKQYPKAKQSVIQKPNMSQKNSNVAIKVQDFYKNNLIIKAINKIYKSF